MRKLEQWLNAAWYSKKVKLWFLLPLEWFFQLTVILRRKFYKLGIFSRVKFNVPIVVIGNITVGGAGKTPLVIYLVELLKSYGLKAGVVSRGYKGKLKSACLITGNTDPKSVGEEAVLIAKKTEVPVFIGGNRTEAVGMLLRHYHVDVVLSDDGLQHYSLPRDIEVIVIDGFRRFGNNHALPVGPLREPITRLGEADFVVANGFQKYSHEYLMKIEPLELVNVYDENIRRPLSYFTGRRVHAVTAIANPEPFFRTLEQNQIKINKHVFPDHYYFNLADFNFFDKHSIIMTEKDAIKCREFLNADMWYVNIRAILTEEFNRKFLKQLEGVMHARQKAFGNIGLSSV